MNIGKCPGNPPPKGTSDKKRKIAGGPKYSKAEVLPLLEVLAIRIWTVKCGLDIAKLGLELTEVADIVTEAISNGEFKCSEWCSQNPDGPEAICDAYVLIRSEWNKAARKYIKCEYYIKLAINKGGNVLLLVSCHI
ncbi:MAG: hypothetical protein ABL869_00505 [Candidatus Nitrotoga sp.]